MFKQWHMQPSSFQSLCTSLRLMLPSLFPARHDFPTLRNWVHVRGWTAASYRQPAAQLQVVHREFSPLSSSALTQRAEMDPQRAKVFFPMYLLTLWFGDKIQLRQSLLWGSLSDTPLFSCRLCCEELCYRHTVLIALCIMGYNILPSFNYIDWMNYILVALSVKEMPLIQTGSTGGLGTACG